MNTNESPFKVSYGWRDARGAMRFGSTVATGTSQADAELKFQRQNEHVWVIPARFEPFTHNLQPARG
jgi:hypothetical protein